LSYRYDRALGYEPPSGSISCEIHYSADGYSVGAKGRIAPEWRAFYEVASPPGFSSDGTVFVGGLRTPSGRRVLVAVDVQTTGGVRGRPEPPFHVRAFSAPDRFDVPQQYLDSQMTVPLQPFFDLRLFAGRRDPQDDTHFTIPYDSDGQPGSIDGWVKESSVKLELRASSSPMSRPATPPPPASPG
jgi:hypothetical protein